MNSTQNNIPTGSLNLSEVRRTLHSTYADADIRLSQIETQLGAIEAQLDELPTDDFSCRINKNGCKWFRGIPIDEDNPDHDDGKAHRRKYTYEYIPKSNKPLAEQLAYRKYLSMLKTDLRNERQALQLYMNRVDRGSRHAEKFLASFGIEPLIGPRLSSIYDKAIAWQNAEYDKNNDRPEGLTVPTIGGFRVRSKSEALIANILIERGIPFRYEYVQLIDQRRYCPDFTILHPETGKLVIWEHFGLLSDVAYRSEYLSKVEKYISSGFTPYENLILTYESKEQPFSAEKANDIVKMLFHC